MTDYKQIDLVKIAADAAWPWYKKTGFNHQRENIDRVVAIIEAVGPIIKERYLEVGATVERERLARLADDNALQTGEQLADWIRSQSSNNDTGMKG